MSNGNPQPNAPQRIQLPGVRHIIAVASAKGGVGKSTVSVNLATALQKQGHKVGLMDADIFGPSIPLMMGVRDIPEGTQFPIEKFGVKLMSMGFVLDADKAAAMRGPMIHRYLQGFLTQINWGELDYLLIDMPPGTGDASISLAQTVPLSGTIVVTMPLEVSTGVVRRGLQLFDQLRVPVLGVVETMSYFLCPDNDKKYDIFGTGGGKKLAEELEIPFLGEIPIDPQAARQADAGEPLVHSQPDSPAAVAYIELAKSLPERIEEVAREIQEMPGLEI